MALDPKTQNRTTDTPRDKPMGDRTEHANLERPGAKAHPTMRGRFQWHDPVAAWQHQR